MDAPISQDVGVPRAREAAQIADLSIVDGMHRAVCALSKRLPCHWQIIVLFWELDGTASAYCGAMLEVHCMCCFYPDPTLREKGPGGGCSACSDLASSVPAVMLCTCACSWLGSRQISALWAYALMMN